jgi:plastocyanin
MRQPVPLVLTLWLVTAPTLFVPAAVPAGQSTSTTPTLAPSNTDPEEVVTVTIHRRTFEPDPVKLHAGQKTKLVFYNQDVELHAFVPVGLFAGVHLNVSGNGAPEFGTDGFKRVIIPSEGRAEFRFVPDRPGVYPFFCDMPGHEMKATIVVE